MAEPVHRGACQCGAVRIAATGEPVRVSVCHCRMCQRATGNLLAPLAEFAREAVAIEGSPATYRSSDVAERGFCAGCGTPLFLRDVADGTIELMLGAMADPSAFVPAYNYGTEGRVRWLDSLNTLPHYETGGGPDEDNPILPVSRQAAI